LAAAGVLLIGGCLAFLPSVARSLVNQIAYDACIEVVSGATPEKCRCLAARLAERMVTYDYLHRRLVRDEGVPQEEMERMRRSCGLGQS
jgi:hypothetical protein